MKKDKSIRMVLDSSILTKTFERELKSTKQEISRVVSFPTRLPKPLFSSSGTLPSFKPMGYRAVRKLHRKRIKKSFRSFL